MTITRTLSCLLAAAALANPLLAGVYTNGPARVVASAWYCDAHRIADGGSLELHLDAGCTLGGGWHKNIITVGKGGTVNGYLNQSLPSRNGSGCNGGTGGSHRNTDACADLTEVF